jgi:hypothetical protein
MSLPERMARVFACVTCILLPIALVSFVSALRESWFFKLPPLPDRVFSFTYSITALPALLGIYFLCGGSAMTKRTHGWYFGVSVFLFLMATFVGVGPPWDLNTIPAAITLLVGGGVVFGCLISGYRQAPFSAYADWLTSEPGKEPDE